MGIMQVPFGFIGAAHVSIFSLKSAALAPANEILLICKTPAPVFVTAKLTGELAAPTSCDAKLMLAGDVEIAGTAPIPASATE